jgi:hypothetical protein
MNLKINGGTGLTSCLSVRLDAVTRFINEHNQFPSSIDGSSQFKLYSDYEDQNVSEMLIGSYNLNEVPYLKDYNHGWQYGWSDEINLNILSEFAKIICPPSEYVLNKSKIYQDVLEDRTAVLYRGNDKAFEIARTPYVAMEEMANKSESKRFLVQTDEEEFYQYFKERFPDTICFDDIPRINKNPDSYVMPQIGLKTDFAINFFAALMAISKSPTLIINTGNTGHWATIFRGKADGVYQWHGNESKWKNF